MFSPFILLSCIGPVLHCHTDESDSRDVAMLERIPSVAGERYRCGDMIQVVNHLRQLGKDRSLAVLRKYLSSDGAEDAKVLFVCRLLFTNPSGWKPPRLGESVPAIKGDVAKIFPLFPIALSDRVPFLVVKGYRLGGRGESATLCLKLCEDLALVTKDYPLLGYKVAARDLSRTESFRQLYDNQDIPQMIEMIMQQADPGKAASKR
jgi:hypothetical protein